MIYQERYWREMDQLKVHVLYLELYLEKTINIDRAINMFLAIASSGSIASWVIWQHLSFLWGAIIALSQAINAIKTYLPYAKRLRAVQSASNELESVFINMESLWFKVAEGQLTDEQIHSLQIKYKEKIRQISQKHLGSSTLPKDKKLLEKAKSSAKTYFSNFYPSY
ncbi:hypothetical protein QNZ93_004543 [Vibrio parahaemolyticus]|nr:hypothetical protein [Vibrio parahaemolyticus]ELB2239676.1 hypothetical protein [Vibrio parahaemolyticus]